MPLIESPDAHAMWGVIKVIMQGARWLGHARYDVLQWPLTRPVGCYSGRAGRKAGTERVGVIRVVTSGHCQRSERRAVPTKMIVNETRTDSGSNGHAEASASAVEIGARGCA